MKTTHKKLVGGLLIGLLITSIGAVFATAQTDDTTDETTDETTPQFPFGGRHGMGELGPFAFNLTDEQQTELQDIITAMTDENATFEEIQAAIQEKLDEYGVLDTRLDNEIAQTEQRLTILNREKELRSEGYSWSEINTIIQDEFDLENSTGRGPGMMNDYGFGHGHGRGPHGGPQDFTSTEKSDQ
jgi:hypothetical protein